MSAYSTHEWTRLKGDGTDPVPPLWTPYEAQLRNGETWTGLAITPFCQKLGADLFRSSGSRLDPVAIRLVASGERMHR